MGGHRVLIVDDHGGTREALRRAFARGGWVVDVAGTVAEGLASLDRHPDCLVLDLVLPDGDGEVILRKIRAEDQPIHLVAVTTGVGDQVRLGEVARLRPEVLLQKPMDPDVIFRLCASEIGGRPQG